MAHETGLAEIIISLIPFIFFIFIIAMQFLAVIIGLLTTIFWIFMIIDVVQRRFPAENDKLMWLLLIIFTHTIGAVVYYFMIKKPNKYENDIYS